MDETGERVVNWAYRTTVCERVLAEDCFKKPLMLPRKQSHFPRSEARISPKNPKCNQLKSKDYQCKHKPGEE